MAEIDRGHGRGAVERPLSPHLQIYAPLINMVMSIMHRMTGAALYFGTLLLVAWLVAAASGPEELAFVNSLLGSLPGLVVLVGFTWALMHHLLGGIRHFIWDTGVGYDIPTVNLMSWGTLILSLALTAIIWAAILATRGVL
jgi:succinate dehydrogenase / fumarate reductase, cytochrome b subunit